MAAGHMMRNPLAFGFPASMGRDGNAKRFGGSAKSN